MTADDHNELTPHANSDRDRGAVLILALIFVVAVGLIATALATWATNDLNNSKTFTTVEALHSDATGMMKISIQYVRYNPIISSSQPSGVASPVTACWGGTDPTKLPPIDNVQVAVWCSTVWNPDVANTRTVTFYACPAAVPASVCTLPGKALLTEVVVYDDYPSGTTSAPIQALCTITCGSGMTVTSSTWGPTLVDVQSITPASIAFVQEPSPTSVGIATTAFVEVTGASSLPMSNETVTLSVASGGTLSSASTLTAVTNASGIAAFNNVIPSSAGALILSAVDGALSTTSTAFQVSKGANTVTHSANPTSAQVGGSVTVSATATSGDVIVTSGSPGITVSSTTPTVCTASGGTISLVGVGACTLNFNDSGNANYVAASTSMTFTVQAVGPSQIAVSAASPSVSASATANDTLTLTLETASGATTVSTGTTIVNLAQNGNGYFVDSQGNPISTVSFPNNTSTESVYFGDKTAQAVKVTASSGTLTPGTVAITVTAGAVAGVQVTAPSSVVANSASAAAVTLSLLDQYKNVVTPTADTTVTLASTGRGFLTSSPGGSPNITTVTIGAGTSSVTVYFGDSTAESVQLTASTSGGSGTAFVTVSPAAASRVVVPTTNHTSASSTSNLAVNVALQDTYGNAVTPTADTKLTLASTGGGYFTTTLGGTATTCVTIPANSASATTYFGDKTAETVTITVNGSVNGSCGTAGLSPGTASVVVQASASTSIIVRPSSNSTPVTASGTDATTLTLVDQNGNPVKVTANGGLTLTLTTNTTTSFFAKKNGGSITTVVIPKNSSSVTVYLLDKVAEPVTFTASASASTNAGSATVTFTARAFSQVVMTPSPLTLGSSTVTGTQIDVQAVDLYGNQVTTGPSSPYYITNLLNNQGNYYTANGCFSSQSIVFLTNGDYCNANNADSTNYNYVWPVDLSSGQATVFFGDYVSGDNPQIIIWDANPYTNYNANQSATINTSVK